MILILLIILFFTLFYIYGVKPLRYWRENGATQPNLLSAFYSSFFMMLERKELTVAMKEIYEKYPGARCYGLYRFNTPMLVLKDIDLIKQMVIKDFEYFNEHPDFIPPEADPLFGRTLFSLKGWEWRRMRSILSPTFTSSKMKLIFLLMVENSNRFLDYFLNKSDEVIEIEMKDVSSRYCSDVIATSAFGTEVDSFNNPDNEFYVYGKEMTDFKKFSNVMRIFVGMLLPSIAKLFKIKFLDDKIAKFFTKLIEDTIKIREEKNVIRPDMIHLLMEARKGNLKKDEDIVDKEFATVEEYIEGAENVNITNQEIISQALLFFFAGFDSVSTLICFMAHELCVNQKVQDRLREEIEETSRKCSQKLTYEALVNMKYLDMVLTETLRKWPTQVGYERVCTKPYTIEPTQPNEKPIHIQVGQTILVSTYGMHHDPEIYPNPEVFDPERFSDENKKNIDPYSFQPFGLGPRNCIGSRFALLEAKVMFYYLLSRFRIVPVEKTQNPIELVKSPFSIVARDGFWMGLERI